jgi:hypothetical protein
VADVLRVSALELRYPVAFRILVEPGDASLHLVSFLASEPLESALAPFSCSGPPARWKGAIFGGAASRFPTWQCPH